MDDGDELMDTSGGTSKDYVTREDGTKTTYFDRQIDPVTTAQLKAQRAPKKLRGDAVQEASAPPHAS